MKSVHALGTAFACAFLVAGCTSEPETKTPPSTTEPSKLEIPPVTDPLDASAFADDPCALLDDTQRGQLGLPDAVDPEQTGSTMCDLYADAEKKDPLNFLRVGVQADNGLAYQYAQCDRVKSIDCSLWTVDAIDRYPVIRANDEHLAKTGNCRLFVGVNDNATVVIVDVQADLAAEGPNCDRADRAASMALATLR